MDHIFVQKTNHEHGEDECCRREGSKEVCQALAKCSDNVVSRLEKGTGLKLKANTIHDKVNGYVSISHDDNNHTIHVFITEENEGQNERPSKMPTREQLERLL